jgi:DNA processing protein
MKTMQQQLAMAWAQTRAISPKHKYEALAHFGSLASILRSYLKQPDQPLFASVPAQPEAWLKQEKIPWLHAQHQKHGIQAWVMDTNDYPSAMMDLADPPWVLYAQGSHRPIREKSLSVIGTRKPTTYGRRVTPMLLEPCVQAGMIVVSGLAYGIDGLAHQMSVKAGCPTVAVVAHGLHKTYPAKHHDLRNDILAQGGLILSEYPWGVEPLRYHFHARNRLIAALSPGLLVVEAAHRSGTQITVRHATDLGREVYAVPGCIDSAFSMYPNRLLQEGAKLVRNAQSILEDYEPLGDHATISTPKPQLSVQEQAMWSFLALDEPKTMDQICAEKNMSVADASIILAALEMQGCLEKLDDGRYVRL